MKSLNLYIPNHINSKILFKKLKKFKKFFLKNMSVKWKKFRILARYSYYIILRKEIDLANWEKMFCANVISLI